MVDEESEENKNLFIQSQKAVKTKIKKLTLQKKGKYRKIFSILRHGQEKLQ